MKSFVFFILMVAPLVAADTDVLTSGPRGGGGRGGGGGSRGGGVSRGATPSVNRGSRPAPQRQAAAPRSGGGAQRVQQQIQRQGTQISQRPKPTPQGNRSFSDISRNNAQAARNLQNRVKQNRPEAKNYFDRNFYDSHRYSPNYDLGRGAVLRRAYWNDVDSWVGGGWGYPYYYDSYANPIVVTNQSDFYGESYTPPSETNISITAQAPASATSDLAPSGWMSLGNFVVGSTLEDVQYSNMFIQLAVNQAGEIAGSYYNAATDQMRGIVGKIDKETQEVVFLLSDRADSPLITVGLFNLTQDAATIQVHFTDGTVQPWVIVRME